MFKIVFISTGACLAYKAVCVCLCDSVRALVSLMLQDFSFFSVCRRYLVRVVLSRSYKFYFYLIPSKICYKRLHIKINVDPMLSDSDVIGIDIVLKISAHH